MPSLEREATRLRSLVDDADAIIVGIGSGMSSAAGFNHYNRAGMARAGMEDWQRAFGFKSLFDGFYHLHPSLEQQWAYYARYIDFMLCEPASRVWRGSRSAARTSPRCPHCGWQLVPWVRDDTFLQGAAWREGLGRYERFVRERGDGRVLLLELGVGEMTPGIITLPFWSMAAKLPDAHLLSVNISGGSAPLQLGSKAEAIQADLGALLSTARASGE